MASTSITTILSRGVSVIVIFAIVRFLVRGYIHRSKVRSLKAQGLPVLPHSMLFGHLIILDEFRKSHPPDVNIYHLHTWLASNFKLYFPTCEALPPVVYIDLWPFSDSLALVNDPTVASQFMTTKSLPKARMVKQFIEPLTGCLDIFCTEAKAWKQWRTKLNPGFSQRSLSAMVPEIMEEVDVFVKGLTEMAGVGKWGPVFQLEKKTTNLTFDVICRATLDMRLHEQTRDAESPLKAAFMDQLRLMGIIANAARGKVFGRSPWQSAALARNNRTIRSILLPAIQEKLEAGRTDLQRKTVIDLAIKNIDEGSSSISQTSPEFIDNLVSNLKMFLFAGHDTTTSAICFMTKALQDNPQCLTKLRDEHGTIVGPDTKILSTSPHLLNSLPYTVGVIKETLRLYPLAATIRESHPGFCLVDESTRYPMEGFGLWASAPVIQRHPRYWPKPDEFLPDRWTVPEGHPLHPPSSAWLPFSLGPRNCIGMQLAMIELQLVLIFTVRTFDIAEAWDKWDTIQ
ncbi:Uu.00g071670.m01.CDS01 [Anthostomella pinea]|uniref:Uu.00g071670.m01.CDS01 n=1 Tax=Anthostomella pinea TaxID=933095 RepID=A0AAI8VUX9_9PEZI|nr:Uu.00g071670.m01.CDS01 [Anthostomella pinea]